MESSVDIELAITVAATIFGIAIPFLIIINSLALYILNSLKESDRQQWERIRCIEKEQNKMWRIKPDEDV